MKIFPPQLHVRCCLLVALAGMHTPLLAAGSDTTYDYLDNIVGDNPGGLPWADSYKFGDDECYCSISTFDHGIGVMLVEWKEGFWASVQDICHALGEPPGLDTNELGVSIPIYNDVQCGRGPPNDAGDEHRCPGRVDLGPTGCGELGPCWNTTKLEEALGDQNALQVPIPATHPDIRFVLNLSSYTLEPGGISWADSYSVGDNCYCYTTFDHDIGTAVVDTPFGYITVQQACDLLGPGPGLDVESHPIYNDIQCGNGPPNDAGDEHICPGRVDIGPKGCAHIGPKWNWDNVVVDTGSPDQPPCSTTEWFFGFAANVGAWLNRLLRI